MATGGRVSESFTQGSDEIFEFTCTPCLKDGNNEEAFKQCFDCNEYYCGKCINFHDKFATTSSHNVVEKTQMRKVQASKPTLPLPTQMCQDHHERITTYCDDHDVISCNTCVSISHKNCDGVKFIVDVAQGIKSGSQLKSARASTIATLKDLKKEMISCKKYMATLVNDKTANVQQVNDLTESLIKRIRELKSITVSQIDSKYKDQSDKAAADVTHLDGAITVMEEDLKNLDQSQNSESTVFVDVKLGQRHAAEGRKILQQVGAHCKTSPRLVLKTDVEHFLNDISSLGNLHGDSKVYKAKLNGDYTTKVKKEKKTYDSFGSCLLSDGTVMVTDWHNKRIKRLDASYRVTGHYDMPDKPWGVTCTASNEVAVTLREMKKVQFVSVRDSMSKTRSFRTNDCCRGICYSVGELFVSLGGRTDFGEGRGHVAVYSTNGAHLRTIQHGPSGGQLFSVPKNITANPDGARIYVTDEKRGVVSSDRSGKLVGSFTDPSLKAAAGVCTLDNGQMLVCGRESHIILQFDRNGRKLADILTHTDGIRKPTSLCFDKNTSRLIVTMKDTDTIKVFDLA